MTWRMKNGSARNTAASRLSRCFTRSGKTSARRGSRGLFRLARCSNSAGSLKATPHAGRFRRCLSGFSSGGPTPSAARLSKESSSTLRSRRLVRSAASRRRAATQPPARMTASRISAAPAFRSVSVAFRFRRATNMPAERTTLETLERLGVRVQIDKDARVIVTEVPSLAALTALPNCAQAGEADGNAPADWYTGGHFKSVADAREAINAGAPPESLVRLYDESRGRLESTVESLARLAPSLKRRRVHSEDGDDVDFDRLATSDPQCWETRTRGARRRRVVIGLQATYVCTADASTYANAAALGTAAADLFGRLGYAVDVCSLSWHDGNALPGRFNRYRFFNLVSLKATNERLDALATLVTGIPAYSRLLEFSVWDAFCAGAWNASCPTMTPATLQALGVDVLIGSRLTAAGGHAPDLRGILDTLGAAMGGRRE